MQQTVCTANSNGIKPVGNIKSSVQPLDFRQTSDSKTKPSPPRQNISTQNNW